MMQYVVTPAAGKRLIAKAIARHDAIVSALKRGTVVIVAGTTNGYVAEEVLRASGQTHALQRNRFFRGITVPPAVNTDDSGRLPDESRFPGDVVVENGTWKAGKTLFDVVGGLEEGDVILKGANALDLRTREAGILVGHPQGGTIAAALGAVAGKRVRLIIPVGLEKRVVGPLHELARLLNEPGAKGARMLTVSGEVVTEIEALEQLAGVKADLVAAGGVCGAEGAVWLAVRGSQEAMRKATAIMGTVTREPLFAL